MHRILIFSCEANRVSRTRENKKKVLQEVELLLNKASQAKTRVDEQKIVKKARMRAMKHRLRLSKDVRRIFCKKCNSLWKAGKTLRVRTSRGKVVYTCLVCKSMKRFRYE